MFKGSFGKRNVSLNAAEKLYRAEDIMTNMQDVPRYTPKQPQPMAVSAKLDNPILPPPPECTVPTFPLSAEQSEAVRDIAAGNSVALLGVAGAGKTAVLVRAAIQLLRRSPPILTRKEREYIDDWECDPDHPYLRVGNPGIVVCAWTRNAVKNLQVRMPSSVDWVYEDDEGNTVNLGKVNLKTCCITIHKLLQYRMTAVLSDGTEAADDDDMGDTSFKKQWRPYRRQGNYLPPEIRHIIIDEGTLVNMSLLGELFDAIHPSVRVSLVISGDIYQIPSLGGTSALAALSTFMPVHALTKIYRHDGHILDLATSIRNQATSWLPYGSNDAVGSGKGSVRRVTYATRNPAPAACTKFVGDMLSKAIISGSFFAGIDLAIAFHDPDLTVIPDKFGITNVYRAVQCKVDSETGVYTHYIKTASRDKHNQNAVVLAVGDVVAADFGNERSMYLVCRIHKNPTYSGQVFPPATYATRDPKEWARAANIDNNVLDESALLAAMQQAAASEAMLFDTSSDDEEVKVADDGSEVSVGRKATHYLWVMDVQALLTECNLRAGELGNLYAEHIAKRISYIARILEYQSINGGKIVLDDEFKTVMKKGLGMYGIEDLFDELFYKVISGAEIKDIKPWITTAHSVQGLSGRKVVIASHPDTVAYTEMWYTAVTRAQEQVLTVSHSHVWGMPTKEQAGTHGMPTRSDIMSPQIKGITISEKLESIRDNLRTGKGGVFDRDLDRYRLKLFGDAKYNAGWQGTY